ncbi:MAG: hypothetical protein WHT09_11275, partial [Thermogutta sp.]
MEHRTWINGPDKRVPPGGGRDKHVPPEFIRRGTLVVPGVIERVTIGHRKRVYPLHGLQDRVPP